jgi:hypothetical protein
MTKDSFGGDESRAKRITVSEMAGSTAVIIDVLPGDSFGQIAEKVSQGLNKNAPVTIFTQNGQPFPPNEEAYSRVQDEDQLLYSVTNTGGSQTHSIGVRG